MHQFPAQHLCTNFFTCNQRWCQVHNIPQVPSKAEYSKTSPVHRTSDSPGESPGGYPKMSCGWYVLLEKTPLPSFKFAKNPVKDRRNNGIETKYAEKFQRLFLETQ
jgi:hypothetical protein